MLSRLRNNFGLKALAFVMALCTAILVKTLARPIQELPTQRVFTKTIDILEPANSNLISSVSPSEVTVSIRGKKNILDRVDPNLISAMVDLSTRQTVGTALGAVDVMAPGGAEVSSVEPSHVWASVSRRVTSNVPVRVSIVGKPLDGYRLLNPIIEPAKVRVVGGMENVDKVAAVVAPIAVSEAEETFSTRVQTLNAVDGNGNTVPQVEVYTTNVYVTLPIVAVQKLPVSLKNISLQGLPDWEYKLTCKPSTVIVGREEGREKLGSLGVEKIVLPVGREVLTKTVRLELPEHYHLYDLPQGTVQVTVTPRSPAESEPIPLPTPAG